MRKYCSLIEFLLQVYSSLASMTNKGSFVQTRITSYFTEVGSEDSGSLSSNHSAKSDSKSVDSYPVVSETPRSKIGNLPWYLGTSVRIRNINSAPPSIRQEVHTYDRSFQTPTKGPVGRIAKAKAHSPTSSCASVTGNSRKLF